MRLVIWDFLEFLRPAIYLYRVFVLYIVNEQNIDAEMDFKFSDYDTNCLCSNRVQDPIQYKQPLWLDCTLPSLK